MSFTRRKFLGLSSQLLLASATFNTPLASGKSARTIKAIAFDAFPIFDPRPVFGLVKKMFPEKGKQFSVLWRTRIFEYTWLYASAGKYQDFWACINDALVYTARHLQVKLSSENKDKLMNTFLSLKAYPDVKNALSEFKAAGIKLAFLSNMTEKMLMSGIKNSGLEGYFDHVLSTDRVKSFKPDAKAYQLGVEAFNLDPHAIAFAAFANWDAVGAKWFGYPTVWVNRLNFAAEELKPQPDTTGRDMAVLKKYVMSTRTP